MEENEHSHEPEGEHVGAEGCPEPALFGTTLADGHSVSADEAEQALDSETAGEPELPQEDPQFEEDDEGL